MSEFSLWPPTRPSLIQRLRDRADQESWRAFDGLYRPVLHVVARRFGLSTADADDLVQDIFAKVFPALAEFELDRERGRFRSWLKTIAIHALSDRRKNRHFSPLDSGHEPAVQDPLEKVWDEEYRRQVLSFALSQVRQASKPKTWACFTECKLKGRPAADVAASLGMSVDAVHQNVARTMNRLCKQCEDYEEEPGIPDIPEAGIEAL
ncbi:MAG TPA: sigma-70 family RNA polymerase sigma factor [Planctomycetaceae bacterium]|nr:sigma-70 family RNA polymerase sigma factor [Planctomycetaceae bacterium]